MPKFCLMSVEREVQRPSVQMGARSVHSHVSIFICCLQVPLAGCRPDKYTNKCH